MKTSFKFLTAFFALVAIGPLLADPTFLHILDDTQFQNPYLNPVTGPRPRETHLVPSSQGKDGATTDNTEKDPRVRSHQEGILAISGTTITPARISVKAGPASLVGSIELSIRNETNARWFFRAENVDPDTNIWDSRGRVVMVPGKLTCHISHRSSINNYEQSGLTLAVESPVVGFSNGISFDQLRSDFFEGEEMCPLGQIPAFTSQKDIERQCKQCLGNVLKTLKEDVTSRIATLFFKVNTPICSQDSDCYRENSDWLRGRCVLVKDKNGSHFSECRARSSIGGSCPGKGSKGLFEYPCDKDLACVKTYSAKTFMDANRYECRDPKNWKFKGPR